MRIRSLLVATGVAVASATIVAAPANAATCQSHTVTYKVFVGHSVNAEFRECHGGSHGAVPRQILSSVSKPVITLPTRVPTGMGEKVKLTQAPSLYSHTQDLWKYRFTVNQGIVVYPPTSAYRFELQVRSRFLTSLAAPVGRICFVGNGGGCSTWQN